MNQKTKKYNIVVCDDEEGIRNLLCKYLESEGHSAIPAAHAEQARDYLAGTGTETRVDILVTDLRMPGMGGMALLEWLQREGPAIPAFVISAYGEVRDAVEAMRLGASDYLVKPFEPDELLLKIDRVMAGFSNGQEVLRNAPAKNLQRSPTTALASKAPAMRALAETVKRAAPSTASILITGESGTGKEVLARTIHELSARADGPFVPINLGGIPESLLESELFGFERGAFTGADKRKLGLFELAHGGTLFLDEIGDMPLGLQVKILRVLQDRRIQRLGGTSPMIVDLRIVAATNARLDEAVREGRFREDLLYRLKVIPLELPPLRERMEDLPALCEVLLAKHDRGSRKHRLSTETLRALAVYRFPGNIRELENLIERALILCEGDVLEPRDFGLGIEPSPHGIEAIGEAAKGNTGDAVFRGKLADETLGDGANRDLTLPPIEAGLEALEKWAILRALERSEGRREKTAELLGISRRTLLNKLKLYGIQNV